LKECFCLFNKILIGLIFIIAVVALPVFAQDDYDPSVCLDCHDTKAASLMGSPHEIENSELLSSPIKVACQNCHDGWQEHINDPSPDNITKGPGLTLLEQSEVCSRCHVTPHQRAMVSTDPHQHYGVNCSSCHTIHDNHNTHLLKDDSDNYCLTCHSSVAFQFEQRSVHPLKTGNIKCIDCHDMSSIVTGEKKVGLDWRCQGCHEELSGPFIHEHPVVYNYLVEGESCMECHSPHGSPNDRLLKQPGNGTCFQCHATPPGHFTNHSGLGSKLYCVQCHSDIHGSNTNRLFLDPDLGSKFFPDCYQSGCHAANN
jgi:DmsE family decaheme c-type cytochrome